MKAILAIDPGNEESAFVLYSPGMQIRFGKLPNKELLTEIDNTPDRTFMHGVSELVCVIERIESYGMAVGREVFETCFWIGRFMERWHIATSDTCEAQLLSRRAVKLHLCNSAKAKDGNVRQALIDRFGGKAIAIGGKKKPGPLYGVSGDVWSALAVAVTYEGGSAE